MAAVSLIVAVVGMQLESRLNRKLDDLERIFDKFESKLESRFDRLERSLALQLVAFTVAIGFMMYLVISSSSSFRAPGIVSSGMLARQA